MPFKSKAQVAKFAIMEKRGEIPKGTTKQWAKETRDMEKLPKHVSKKK